MRSGLKFDDEKIDLSLVPRTFQRMVDKRIADGLKTQWRTGQDVWDWWVSHKEKGKEEDEAKLTIFEG